ncbi:ferritin [bacterium]|jgi:ferritin|nr:ferritin [bacterium]
MKRIVNESIFSVEDLRIEQEIGPGPVIMSATNIVDAYRLNENILSLLNEQIKNELNASQIYRSMSCWLNDQKWPSGSKLFFTYANEELNHMNKIYNYIFSKNCQAIVPCSCDVETEFPNIKNLIETALQHEIEVSEEWENICNCALKYGDNTTVEFSQWFLKEQIEEEEKFREMLEIINLDMPNYEIEKMFKELIKN